jgi:hypothetical protein
MKIAATVGVAEYKPAATRGPRRALAWQMQQLPPIGHQLPQFEAALCEFTMRMRGML